MQFAIEHAEQVDKLIIVDMLRSRTTLTALCLGGAAFVGFEDFVSPLPMSIPLWRKRFQASPLRQFLLKNLARDERGRLRWKIHLEAIYRNYDKLARGVAPEPTFDKPTLFIRGGRSNYIEDDDVPLIRQCFHKSRSRPYPRPVTGFTSKHRRSFCKRF